MGDKSEKLNLDTIIWNRIHYPLVNGKPLFKRVDGLVGTNDDVWGNDSDRDKWVSVAENCYTSPDNIRKVIIAVDYVLVEYYRPFAGSKEPLNKMLFNKVGMGKLCIDDLIHRAYNENRRVDSIVQISGTGLGGLVKPWVCSNIEEVYFDYSILISPELSTMCADIISQMGADISNTTLLDVYMKAGRIPVQAIERIFRISCLKGVEDVRDRFPRLKAVGFVSDLKMIYDTEYKNRGQISLLGRLSRDLCRHTYIREYVRDKRASVWVLDDIPKLNTKFSIKDNIYSYDRDILTHYILKVESEVEKALRMEKECKRMGDTNRDDEDTARDEEGTDKDVQDKDGVDCSNVKSILEEALDKLENGDRVKRYLSIVLHNIDSSTRSEIYNSMTLEGQRNYGKYVRGE